MRRFLTIVVGLLSGLYLLASPASAQWRYPRALRARQRALREEDRKKAIKWDSEREVRVERIDLRDGTTLNNLLTEIFDGDPAVAKSGRAKTPLSPSAIREIPFEWDSEAISVCIDQMTGKDALPPVLMRPIYVNERNALRSAVEPALAEDAKRSVSLEARKRIADAISGFRSRFTTTSNDFDAGYQDALDYFATLASLTRLLNDPSMKSFLSQLDDGQERTVGDLIAFMNAYNLRFGPATSDHQIEIYTRLVPALTAIRDAPNPDKAPSPEPDRTGEGLKSAAQQAFKFMGWDELEAHLRGL
jgi:hypothetical protein